MKPHRNEWNRLRQKYWRAMQNIGRARSSKRRTYWQHEVKRLGGRLLKMSRRYPPLPKMNPAGAASLPTAMATLRNYVG